MEKLIIVGASGFGKEVAWLTERINENEPSWEILGFIDDNPKMEGQIINGYKVLGTVDCLAKYKDAYVVCAIGSSNIRCKIVNKIKKISPETKFATLIDPSVVNSSLIEIGEGTIICAHTVATVNIKIGKHVIINLDCTIGHSAVLSDYDTLYPSVNVSGDVYCGKNVELGTGTQIIQGKSIGDNTIVGAGAIVISDLPSNCTAVGSPARPIKINK